MRKNPRLPGSRGILYREDGSIQFTGEPEPVENLDELPFDWELIDPAGYYRRSGQELGEYCEIQPQDPDHHHQPGLPVRVHFLPQYFRA